MRPSDHQQQQQQQQQALVHAYYATSTRQSAVNHNGASNDAFNGLSYEEAKQAGDWISNNPTLLPYFHGGNNQEFSANLASLQPHSWPATMSAKATEQAIDEMLGAPNDMRYQKPQQHQQQQQQQHQHQQQHQQQQHHVATAAAAAAATEPEPRSSSCRTKRSQIFTEVLCHDCDTWPTSSENQLPLLEINPGFVVRLHGYKETWEACQQPGKTTITSCPCCSEVVRCVKSAEFVLCQNCRFISPILSLELDPIHRIRKPFQVGGGLALGLVNRNTAIEEQQRKTAAAVAAAAAAGPPMFSSRRSTRKHHDNAELQTIPELQTNFDVLLPPWCNQSTHVT